MMPRAIVSALSTSGANAAPNRNIASYLRVFAVAVGAAAAFADAFFAMCFHAPSMGLIPILVGTASPSCHAPVAQRPASLVILFFECVELVHRAHDSLIDPCLDCAT